MILVLKILLCAVAFIISILCIIVLIFAGIKSLENIKRKR